MRESSLPPDGLDSFDDFAGACVGRLLRTARLLTGNESDAEDLVQDTLLKVHVKWRRVAKASDPVAYATRVLINHFISDTRKRTLPTSPASTDQVSTGVDTGAQTVERPTIAAGLLLLPPQQRTAVVLRYYLDLGGPEIAELMGVKESSARSALSRGLGSLRQRIEAIDEQMESADGRF